MVDNIVTGASGFIGSHLIKRLKGEVQRIPYHDLTWAAMSGLQCRRMFHLSAYGNMWFHENHSTMINSNVGVLAMILVRLAVTKPESFVFASTSSVSLPLQTPYSRTKRAGEEMVLAMPEVNGCVVRPYSVTGVGEQKEHLIPTLIRSCMEGEAMELSDGVFHDFIDVEDVCDAMVHLSDAKARGIYELGTGNSISNEHVLSMVEKACGRKANVKLGAKPRIYDSRHWRCTDFRARDNGWYPKKCLADSIAEMVSAYKKSHA